MRTSATQSSSGSSPAISRPSAPVTGASTPRGLERAGRAAGPTRAPRRPGRCARGISAAGTPSASSSPARRLRLWGASAVATRSPVPGQADHRLRPRALRLGVAPDLGEDVARGGAGGVEALRLGRAGRERGGVLRRARQLDADRVVGQLADDAGAREDLRERSARASSSVEAATSPAPSVTISWACAGPPMHATRSAPKRARSTIVGAMPSGGTSPLASETIAARSAQPGVRRARRSPRRARATGRRGTRSRRARAPAASGLDRAARAAARRRGGRRVFSRSRAQRLGLLGGARLQRRAQPAAGEQHRDGGAERAGADDDGSVGHGRESSTRIRKFWTVSAASGRAWPLADSRQNFRTRVLAATDVRASVRSLGQRPRQHPSRPHGYIRRFPQRQARAAAVPVRRRGPPDATVGPAVPTSSATRARAPSPSSRITRAEPT